MPHAVIATRLHPLRLLLVGVGPVPFSKCMFALHCLWDKWHFANRLSDKIVMVAVQLHDLQARGHIQRVPSLSYRKDHNERISLSH